MRCLLVQLSITLLAATATQGAPHDLLSHEDPAVFHHLVYIGIPDVDRALGCPAAEYGCFYSFGAEAGVTDAVVDSRGGGQEHGCHVVRRNCNAYGECIKRRDWCIVRRGLPAWLLKRFPQQWVTEQRPAYLFGRTDLLNPTHIASLHFLPLMRWMGTEHMPLGQVLMVWDNVPSAGPGPYGLGMAAAFGGTQWLPDMPGPMVFRHIRMGEFGDLRFPYPLDRSAPGLQPDPAFQRLAAAVKQHHEVASMLQPRVVIAQRQRTRILANAGDLQVRLAAAGLRAAVVDFGTMSFEAQVRTVSEAAVLVSVHGADCMNLMFLPGRGYLVEVLPVHYGYGGRNVMRKSDYYNLARLLGKQYTQITSTDASSIIRDVSGQLADWNHVNFVGNVTVDVDAIVSVIRSAVADACDGKCARDHEI